MYSPPSWKTSMASILATLPLEEGVFSTSHDWRVVSSMPQEKDGNLETESSQDIKEDIWERSNVPHPHPDGDCRMLLWSDDGTEPEELPPLFQGKFSSIFAVQSSDVNLFHIVTTPVSPAKSCQARFIYDNAHGSLDTGRFVWNRFVLLPGSHLRAPKTISGQSDTASLSKY